MILLGRALVRAISACQLGPGPIGEIRAILGDTDALGGAMSFNDDFFEELLVLGGTIKEIRYALSENLPPDTLIALDRANAILSSRALQIIESIVSDTQIARNPGQVRTEPGRSETTIGPISSPSTTIPENTSSQPSPSDLGEVSPESKTGA